MFWVTTKSKHQLTDNPDRSDVQFRKPRAGEQRRRTLPVVAQHAELVSDSRPRRASTNNAARVNGRCADSRQPSLPRLRRADHFTVGVPHPQPKVYTPSPPGPSADPYFISITD